MKYARIENGAVFEEIKAIPDDRPPTYRAHELEALGHLPIVEVKEPVDPATQKRGAMIEVIEVDRVLRTWPTVNLTQQELDAKAVNEDRDVISNLDLQLKVLILEFLREAVSKTSPTFESSLPQKIKDFLARVDSKKGNVF